MNKYDVGDVLRLRATFTDSSGVGVDPSSVTFQYRRFRDDPSSVTTVVYGPGSITRVTTGQYFTDLPITSDGEWRYRWNGLGNNASAGESVFSVRTRFVG